MTDTTEEEILFPDVDLEFDGQPVKVSEYCFVDGMKAARLAAPLLASMADLFALAEDDVELVSLQLLGDMFGQHPEAVVDLIALATGEDKAWIKKLSDADGQMLLQTWWRVNSAFFTRRLVTNMVAKRQVEEARVARAAEEEKQEKLKQDALDLAKSAHV